MREVRRLLLLLLLLLAVLDKTEEKFAAFVGNGWLRREVRRERLVAGTSGAVHGGGFRERDLSYDGIMKEV